MNAGIDGRKMTTNICTLSMEIAHYTINQYLKNSALVLIEYSYACVYDCIRHFSVTEIVINIWRKVKFKNNYKIKETTEKYQQFNLKQKNTHCHYDH